MADGTSTYDQNLNPQQRQSSQSLYGDILGTVGGLAQNYLTGQAQQQALDQLGQAYGQAGQYITGAQQQAAGYQQPYLKAGTAALPKMQTAAQQLGTPYTMEQYKASPYYQAAQQAQQQNEAALRAQAATQGMYGSGNMANALQQNALLTQMQGYDTAAQRALQGQQAGYNALAQLGSWGYGAGQSMGNQAMEAAKYMGGLATGAGGVGAAGSMAGAGNTGNYISMLGNLAAKYGPDVANWVSNQLGGSSSTAPSTIGWDKGALAADQLANQQMSAPYEWSSAELAAIGAGPTSLSLAPYGSTAPRTYYAGTGIPTSLGAGYNSLNSYEWAPSVYAPEYSAY